MGLTASLDFGSEKVVMALASAEGRACRLSGIKFVVSPGVQRGVIIDKAKAQACVRGLMGELVKERPLDQLNIALWGDAVKMVERKVTVPVQRKMVEQADLDRAEQRCAEGFDSREEELVDIIPVAYSVDRGELISDPLGRNGRSIDVYYQVYVADYAYLADLRRLFDGYNVGSIDFFPLARVYGEAVDAGTSDRDFAVVDLGAMNIRMALFRGGLLEYEAFLPLGVRTVDYDLMSAFGIDAQKARKLKHEYGQALRSACKNRKLVIPDTNLNIDSRDMVTVIQSRMEELLEGVAFQLQNWGFDQNEEILLTGGGSRLVDVDVLLHRISGHPVDKARVIGVQSSREEVLRTPEYFTALGLLLCVHQEPQEEKGGLLGKFKKLFG